MAFSHTNPLSNPISVQYGSFDVKKLFSNILYHLLQHMGVHLFIDESEFELENYFPNKIHHSAFFHFLFTLSFSLLLFKVHFNM